jgi:hypothetical protein
MITVLVDQRNSVIEVRTAVLRTLHDKVHRVSRSIFRFEDIFHITGAYIEIVT